MPTYLCPLSLFLLLPPFQLHEEEMCEQRQWEELPSFRVTFVVPIIPERDKCWGRRKKRFGVDIGSLRWSPNGNTKETQVIRDLNLEIGTAWRERGGICLGMIPNIMSVDQKLGASKSKCLEIERVCSRENILKKSHQDQCRWRLWDYDSIFPRGIHSFMRNT